MSQNNLRQQFERERNRDRDRVRSPQSINNEPDRIEKTSCSSNVVVLTGLLEVAKWNRILNI